MTAALCDQSDEDDRKRLVDAGWKSHHLYSVVGTSDMWWTWLSPDRTEVLSQGEAIKRLNLDQKRGDV